MNAPTTPALDARRAAARRTAWIVGAVAFSIFGLFWLAGIVAQ